MCLRPKQQHLPSTSWYQKLYFLNSWYFSELIPNNFYYKNKSFLVCTGLQKQSIQNVYFKNIVDNFYLWFSFSDTNVLLSEICVDGYKTDEYHN